MKSSNPILDARVFQNLEETQQKMELQGVANITIFSIILLMISTAFTWYTLARTQLIVIIGIVVVSAIVSLIMTAALRDNRKLAPSLVHVFPIVQGIFFASMAYAINRHYKGIIIQGIWLTYSTLFMLAIIYKFQYTKPRNSASLKITVTLLAIGFVYGTNFFIRKFTNVQIPYIHESSIAGIGFVLYAAIMAAYNLVLDFYFIAENTSDDAPKYMEHYCAFALNFSLIWLYIDILFLVDKYRRRFRLKF
ncbi:Bax inhibitor-1/YccA family membrane protein [Candidatus Uabimicrobium amorphum]|uniref:Membrane protein n=1 Tax=Uabimicrobium amorphum TaxID=2596890 RepID=A0A5S9F5P1_UABAM|nr:Bax inhibitor-1/YccA family protein [Candidatus Uabimicrobium amorphum]BBM86828.1 membrane protein [Candidatus Uabimicrobium amorphum]